MRLAGKERPATKLLAELSIRGTVFHVLIPMDLSGMSLEVIGKTAAQAQVKTVVLSHLTQRFGSTDYTPWAEEVKKYFTGAVVVASDLMEF